MPDPSPALCLLRRCSVCHAQPPSASPDPVSMLDIRHECRPISSASNAAPSPLFVSPAAATRDTSNLLAHEAAFALGQMQDAEAIPALETVLNDFSLHPNLRHEATEALGAIGLERNASLLENSLASDLAPEGRETCELALSRIWNAEIKGVFTSS